MPDPDDMPVLAAELAAAIALDIIAALPTPEQRTAAAGVAGR